MSFKQAKGLSMASVMEGVGSVDSDSVKPRTASAGERVDESRRVAASYQRRWSGGV